MYTLFIDTHCSLITVAIINESDCFVLEKESKNSHSNYLLPMINNILKMNKINFENLKDIIVINGPGSFTGLRIGLTVAKTLSYILNIPIRTLSTTYAYLISSSKNTNKGCVIEEKKGYYISIVDENNEQILKEQYVKDLSIMKNYEYILVENKLNLKKIYQLKNKIKEVNAHNVKANYVKRIEVEKNE